MRIAGCQGTVRGRCRRVWGQFGATHQAGPEHFRVNGINSTPEDTTAIIIRPSNSVSHAGRVSAKAEHQCKKPQRLASGVSHGHSNTTAVRPRKALRASRNMATSRPRQTVYKTTEVIKEAHVARCPPPLSAIIGCPVIGG